MTKDLRWVGYNRVNLFAISIYQNAHLSRTINSFTSKKSLFTSPCWQVGVTLLHQSTSNTIKKQR